MLKDVRSIVLSLSFEGLEGQMEVDGISIIPHCAEVQPFYHKDGDHMGERVSVQGKIH